MPSFRPESHKALAEKLRHRRKEELKLSLEAVADKLPAWMGFDFSVLARVERGVRKVTYSELREIAAVLGTTVGELDSYVTGVLSAKTLPPPVQAKRPRRPGRKK